MPSSQLSELGQTVVRRAEELARRSGAVNPAHLLAAVLEVSDSLGEVAAWAHVHEAHHRAAPDDGRGPERVVHHDTLARQALVSAGAWAARRGVRAGPADLLVVLLDQHSPSVVAATARMGPDGDRLRHAALRMLGLPDEYGPVPLEPVPPAGQADRTLLDIDELPPGAWAALEERHRRLPLRRVRGPADWAAVRINEQRAVRRMAARRALTDLQTSSLVHHHGREVDRLAADALPPAALGPAPRERDRLVRLKAAWFRWTAQRY